MVIMVRSVGAIGKLCLFTYLCIFCTFVNALLDLLIHFNFTSLDYIDICNSIKNKQTTEKGHIESAAVLWVTYNDSPKGHFQTTSGQTANGSWEKAACGCWWLNWWCWWEYRRNGVRVELCQAAPQLPGKALIMLQLAPIPSLAIPYIKD